jgi:4-amino-4-deoxy-L-arabinose transferase-like glycosyltransferase
MDSRRKSWIAVSALICGGLIYVYPLALQTPLLDRDEGFHAAISQEMVENGDYLVPRFLGKPFLDKPILYFEAQALSLRCFGMNEAAVRLPGLMFALLGAVTTSLLAWRLFDGTTGLLALLVSLTSIAPLSLAQAAVHDVALVPWTNALLMCWWTATHEDSRRRRIAFTAAAALFACLAILTKGLIGIAVVWVGYSLYIVVTRQRAARFVICTASSISVGLLLASPWFLEMEHQSPGYLFYYFIERHILGFVTHTQLHGREPWYFYLPLLLGGTAPWILLTIPSLWQSWTDRRSGRISTNRATLFVICWLLGGLIFLSAAKSKLITYALPLYPATAILAGHACKQFLEGDMVPIAKKVFGWIFLVSCLIGTLAPFGILVGLDRFNHANSPIVAYLAASIAMTPMIVALLLTYRDQPIAALAIGSLLFPLLFVTIMTWPMQTIAGRLSQRQLAHEIRSLSRFPDHIDLVGAQIGSIIFYLEPEQRRALRPGQIAEVDPRVVCSWSTPPTQTLLALSTATWARCSTTALAKHVRQLAVAGDYHLMATEYVPFEVGQRPGKRVW